MKINFFLLSVLFCVGLSCCVKAQSEKYNEAFRPQTHFSPKAHWINDPNGMVYYKGTYHLFFQYYPGDIVWGPMHWGHAESTDLIHWKELSVALFPDSLGYIFSGSAVVDANNTAGFGKNGKVPLVAIFTHHNPKGEKAGVNNFQNESLAYSLDDGKTWTKYNGNPVLHNPGIKDFRDPKVMWYSPEKKWVMTLATKDRITFYSSPNLKTWKKESEFGLNLGAHGGVWECPDLFPLKLKGQTHWVLIVNINPGGPNKGSATQYFIGQFNGQKFTPIDSKLRWLDYGPDEYAGVTWSNTGNRKIFLGWMSNWEYANKVPTKQWRNAMTIPRELSLKVVNNEITLASAPVKELNLITAKPREIANLNISKKLDLLPVLGNLSGQYILKLNGDVLKDFSLVFSNPKNEQLTLGYNSKNNQYYIDRIHSGLINFSDKFAGKYTAPRLAIGKQFDLTLIVDNASVELFADEGTTLMTCLYFSTQPYNQLKFQTEGQFLIKQLSVSTLKSIWQ